MIAVNRHISSHPQNIDTQKGEIQQWMQGQRIKHILWLEDKDRGASLNARPFTMVPFAMTSCDHSWLSTAAFVYVM